MPSRSSPSPPRPKATRPAGSSTSFSTEQLKDFQERAESFSDVVGFMVRIGGLVGERHGPRSSGSPPSATTTSAGSASRRRPARSSPASPARPCTSCSVTRSGGRRSAAIPTSSARPMRVDGAPAVITGVVQESFRGTLIGDRDGRLRHPRRLRRARRPDVKRWLYHNRKARPIQLFGAAQAGRERQRRAGRGGRADDDARDRVSGDRSGHRRAIVHAGTARAADADARGARGDSAGAGRSGWRSPAWCCCSRA